MSGDVQPRKRKDKKKKKDEDDIKETSQPSTHHHPHHHASTTLNDDIQLHIQKDHGTGGHWCAKIVFFALMAILFGLIGLIILENRGLTDLETPVTESRFSEYFDGWVEETQHEDHHETSDHNSHTDHDDHDDDHDDPNTIAGDDHSEEDHDDERSKELDTEDHSDEEDEGISNMVDSKKSNEKNELDDKKSDENDSNSEEENDKSEETDIEEKHVRVKRGLLAREISDEQDDDDDIDNNKNDDDDEDEGFDDQMNDDTSDDDDHEKKKKENSKDSEQNDSDNAPFEELEDDGSFEDERVIENDSGEDLLLEKLSKKDKTLDETEETIEENSSQLPSRGGGPQNVDDNILRNANKILSDNPKSALKLFESILKNDPLSTEALFGKAQTLDRLAAEQQSNFLLDESIKLYTILIRMGNKVDNEIFKAAGERCIDRLRFKGQHLKAVEIHEDLIKRFVDKPEYRNQLAITYLLVNRLSEAKKILHETLLRWRTNGVALVHYGFVLKVLDKNMEKSAQYLKEGIDTGEEGTNDGRFYFSLGEALTRLGRTSEAHDIYKLGAKKKLFLSQYQRSLYNVDRLKSQPFWTKKNTTYTKYFNILEQNWEKIRHEGLNVLNQDGYFKNETEDLRDIGQWKQFDLFAQGQKRIKNCEKTPFTCKIIEMFPAARFCKRGQVKFSVMHPGTHVWPHCGPTNCRIRAHLGLKVPTGTLIRVADETRTWENGKILIFDDSFEHEVWHNGTTPRLILIIDVWHPDLTEQEWQMDPI